MKRLVRVRALFGFLRLHRHELFDEAFQEQLESMYRTMGAGDPPRSPGLLCMVVLLQGYVGASDAEAVELSLMDLRWQMVLDCMGAAEPPFSQGGLQAFRERMIAHEMDRVLLDRTVSLVRSGALTEGEGRSVSKALRAAVDSRPLAGVGRVEDTINLLGHRRVRSDPRESARGGGRRPARRGYQTTETPTLDRAPLDGGQRPCRARRAKCFRRLGGGVRRSGAARPTAAVFLASQARKLG